MISFYIRTGNDGRILHIFVHSSEYNIGATGLAPSLCCGTGVTSLHAGFSAYKILSFILVVVKDDEKGQTMSYFIREETCRSWMVVDPLTL